jgi:hypothetical protein
MDLMFCLRGLDVKELVTRPWTSLMKRLVFMSVEFIHIKHWMKCFEV